MKMQVSPILTSSEVQTDPAWIMGRADDEVVALQIDTANAIVVGVDGDHPLQLIEPLAVALLFFLH
jgi:hypothetical protein